MVLRVLIFKVLAPFNGGKPTGATAIINVIPDELSERGSSPRGVEVIKEPHVESHVAKIAITKLL